MGARRGVSLPLCDRRSSGAFCGAAPRAEFAPSRAALRRHPLDATKSISPSQATGCGGTLYSGTCTLPQTCGGGGTPNVCGAPGVCGNGIVEYPEWCDGESFCASNCTIVRYACCQFATGSGGCSKDVPAFTLFANQYGVCGTYGGTFEMGLTAPAGSACTDPPSNVSGLMAGPCVEPPPLAAPINLCCQSRLGPVCGDVSTASDSAITQFIWELRLQQLPGHPDRARDVRRRRSLRVRSLIRPAA